MPRQRPTDAPKVALRTARIALRTTAGQRRRCFSLLRSGGDVWACALELKAVHRQRGTAPIVSYQELCRANVGGRGTRYHVRSAQRPDTVSSSLGEEAVHAL